MLKEDIERLNNEKYERYLNFCSTQDSSYYDYENSKISFKLFY